MISYILIGKNPVAITQDQHLEWGRWMQHQPRHVAYTKIPAKKPLRKGNPRMLKLLNLIRTQDVVVSTVFLGLDHRHFGEGHPILFETMIFGGKDNDAQWRYCDWDTAAGHHAHLIDKMQ
ncbi:conserved hypothetical protein [Vibrio coralliirubri]|uniref:hypothetical protein n=1 Tax=Vibrio coralliirubri TaxID=1516159 RepID=UPI000631A467|nr:hypothetical protein [Vibrio coralliirubri]CDT54045.1 conserved hypothetical protein [Vibrio coralliirubri]